MASKQGKKVKIRTVDTVFVLAVSEELLFFHAFTGCDQVPYFNSIGKLAWESWMAMVSMTDVFKVLSKQPFHQNVQDSMEMISRYTVVIYNRTSNSANVNET